MKLAELQAEFQKGILAQPDKILASIRETPRLSREDRFAVYEDAYRLRLGEVLGNDYPILRKALGDETFGAIVGGYIDTVESHHPNVRWYSRKLPDYMASHEPWSSQRLFVDLAFFERALEDAFDAADADALALDAVMQIALEDQPNMCFAFQPSLKALSTVAGTIAAYEAAAAEETIDISSDGGQEVVLIWRNQALDSVYRILSEDEALALDAAMTGGSFADICGLLAVKNDAEMVAATAGAFLGQWFVDGLIVGVSLAGATSDPRE
jgi:Putative DNA-binding domain